MGRAELGAVLSCAATNNNVTAPVSRRVSLEIVFPPAEVAITSVGQPLVAGVTYLVACEAAGSRPDPVISWWLASQIMAEDAQQLVEVVGEVTRYTLHSPVYIISTQYLLNIYLISTSHYLQVHHLLHPRHAGPRQDHGVPGGEPRHSRLGHRRHLDHHRLL